jgi:hypothetical protein
MYIIPFKKTTSKEKDFKERDLLCRQIRINNKIFGSISHI